MGKLDKYLSTIEVPSDLVEAASFGIILPIGADGKFTPPLPAGKSVAENQLTYLINYLETGNFQNHILFRDNFSEMYGPSYTHFSVLEKIISKPETEEIRVKVADAIAKFVGEVLMDYPADGRDGPLECFVYADSVKPGEKILVLEKLLENKDLPAKFRSDAERYLLTNKELIALPNGKKTTVTALGSGIPKDAPATKPLTMKI
ncbi:MAG: hypothetical protein WCT52_03790 [Candidatus Micrarchaeia archaeon]|jgi:hypothetical protein